MKNPNKADAVAPAVEYTPLNEIARWINSHSGQLTYGDMETILDAGKKLIAWYRLDEKGQRQNADARFTNADAKQEGYWNTGLTPTLRRELATIFDTLAIRAGRPRWTFPVDKKGNIVIKPYQCYV